MDDFDRIWEALSKGGHCDALGSVEYTRVRLAWERYGYFNHLWQFIIASANEPVEKARDKASAEGGAL